MFRRWVVARTAQAILRLVDGARVEPLKKSIGGTSRRSTLVGCGQRPRPSEPNQPRALPAILPSRLNSLEGCD